MVRAHVIVTGFVQAVGFRHGAGRKAEALGLTGWVRNTWDGKVEAVFEGEKEKVEKMIGWCREGPPLAKVERVHAEWGEGTGEFREFTIT